MMEEPVGNEMRAGKNKLPGFAKGCCYIVAFCVGSLTASAEVSAVTRGNEIVLQNDLVAIHYHQRSGMMDVAWRDGHKLMNLASGALLANGQKLTTLQYRDHQLDAGASATSLVHVSGAGEHEYTIRNTSPGTPALLQHIWIYDGSPSIVIQAELGEDASKVGTRHFDAVEINGDRSIDLGNKTALRILHVPYDNDMWFRYNSADITALKANERFSSNEVTAIYDNQSRQAIVLGSVTHDVWKTAIDAHAANGKITDLDIYGGISSPTGVRTDTHDIVPHGVVKGDHVVSPAIFLGSFDDWRDGLEAYGKMNAAIQPPLVWPDGAPAGWNSWAAYADKINERRYLDAGAFVRDNLLPLGFDKSKVVYVNLDAFWSNLDAVQLAEAAENVRAMSAGTETQFEPGIYWTPFAYWSDDMDAYVEGTGMKYRYRDILLKAPDGSLLEKVDGGRPIDPSHPGTKMRTEYYVRKFQEMGFKYLKIDFLTHGALEGNHYDPSIQTGVEAYNLGMRQLVEANQNRMFLSLSIAPLFPSGYGHARRLSCDTKGHISGDQSTEYMLNSLTYGWWTDKNLYITDPDHVVLGERADRGARNVTEGKSRFLSAVIGGGMILDSTRLADDPQGQELAKAVYNRNLFAVAREGKIFRPLEGDTGDHAANVFVRPSANGYYIAAFNFDEKLPLTVRVPLVRVAPEWGRAENVSVTDVASGSKLSPATAEILIELQPSESKLIEIRR